MNTKKSYNFLRIEGVLSSIVISMPIMTTFYRQDLGMNQALIGLSQAAFMASVLALDIPMGWIADRFSRKWANAIGDLTTAGGFILYAFAQDFRGVVISEIILGIGIALTNGADAPLLYAYCEKLGKNFRKETARLDSWKPLGEAIGMIAGGVIGAYSLRGAILLTSVPFIIGAILSMFLIEMGERRKNEHTNPFVDMWQITKYTLHGHKELAWTIFARVTTAELTHAIIWLFTPMLLLAGIPPALVGLAWSINLLAVYSGAVVAKRYASSMSMRSIYGISMGLGIAAILGLSWSLSIATIALFFVTGWVRGWAGAAISPRITEMSPEDMRSTVSSVASSTSRIIYIPLVLAINAVATDSLSKALLLNAAIFAIATVFILPKLRKS